MINTTIAILGAITYGAAFAAGAVIGAAAFWYFAHRRTGAIEVDIECSGQPTRHRCACGSAKPLIYNASGPGELGTYECQDCLQVYDRKEYIAHRNAGSNQHDN